MSTVAVSLPRSNVTCRPSSAVYARRRIAAVAVIASAVFVMMSVARPALGSSPGDASTTAPSTYVVHPGDTMWSIAEGRDPAAVAAYVDQLIELNGSADLAIGQQILIP